MPDNMLQRGYQGVRDILSYPAAGVQSAVDAVGNYIEPLHPSVVQPTYADNVAEAQQGKGLGGFLSDPLNLSMAIPGIGEARIAQKLGTLGRAGLGAGEGAAYMAGSGYLDPHRTVDPYAIALGAGLGGTLTGLSSSARQAASSRFPGNEAGDITPYMAEVALPGKMSQYEALQDALYAKAREKMALSSREQAPLSNYRDALRERADHMNDLAKQQESLLADYPEAASVLKGFALDDPRAIQQLRNTRFMPRALGTDPRLAALRNSVEAYHADNPIAMAQGLRELSANAMSAADLQAILASRIGKVSDRRAVTERIPEEFIQPSADNFAQYIVRNPVNPSVNEALNRIVPGLDHDVMPSALMAAKQRLAYDIRNPGSVEANTASGKKLALDQLLGDQGMDYAKFKKLEDILFRARDNAAGRNSIRGVTPAKKMSPEMATLLYRAAPIVPQVSRGAYGLVQSQSDRLR